MNEKKLRKQVWGLLEDYGFFQPYKFKDDPWDREYRDRFFKAFLIIAERYKKGGEKR